MGVLAAALALGLGQLVKAVTGFGSALVAMPVLLSVYDPAGALLLMVVSDLLSGPFLVRDVWPRVRWSLVAAMLAGVLPGQWLGTELLVVLDPTWIARLLGVVVAGMGMSFVLWPVVPGRGELADLPARAGGLLALGALAGFAGGLLGGVVGAGGPPLVAYARHYFQPAFQRAQLVVTFYASSVVLTAMLIGRGAELGSLAALPWAILPLMLGNRIGTRLAAVVSREAFGRATGLVLVLAGVGLLAR